ncbi:MAG: MFS transporter [Gammaproteobacteria bacterium]
MNATAGLHRRLWLPLYLPALLLGVPAQAGFVLLPLAVLESGAGAAAAAAVVGLRGLGMMALDIPAGMLAARYGERAVMSVAVALLALSFVGYGLAEDVGWFYLVAFLNGAGSSTFLVGRLSYVSAYCAAGERGRAISMIAATVRAAALLGPLAGGAAAHAFGYQATFLGAALCMLLGLVCVFVFTAGGAQGERALGWGGVPRLAWEQRRVFATYGVAAVCFMLMREARSVLLPLIGASLHLDARAIGGIVSASALVDVACTYPAGVIMDRHGRRATAVPSSLLFVASLVALALTSGYASLLAAALLAGLANGLSSGIVMTLGTDLAPPDRRGEFLGVWRLLTDAGSVLGPMAISAVVMVAPLAVATLGVAGLGAMGSFVVYRHVHETLRV